MEKKELSATEKCFEPLTDPRMPGKIRHRLTDIITIAVCAVIAGADTCTAIGEYGKAGYERLKGFPELPHGIPSHDTSGNIFSALSLRESEGMLSEPDPLCIRIGRRSSDSN